MFNQPNARLYRTKITFEDYHYQLYVDGRRVEKIKVPYHIWRKYQIAERKFDLLRARVEKVTAKGEKPDLDLLIKYYDTVKDYLVAKIELEIYYYGTEDPQAKQDLQDGD